MSKVKYEIDPHNRLAACLPRFRKLIDGRFKLDNDNTLTYHVKAPTPGGVNIPHQVKLRGRWALDKNHDLQLTIDKWARQTFGDQLTIQGDIIDINKNSLLFAVTTERKENIRSTYTIKLEGAWQADENNRLTFRVKRERGRYDILVFDGIWEINKNHLIIYRYEKARLLRKRKNVRTLTFKGYWDIRDKARISYIIDRSAGSVFNFRPSFGIFSGGYIKYEIGVGLSRNEKPVKQTVTLFGAWKIKKNAGLLFEVEYEGGKAQSITFGADAELTAKDTISIRLKNAANEDIGGELELSHKLLKGNGEAFLRMLKSKRESFISAGAGWTW